MSYAWKTTCLKTVSSNLAVGSKATVFGSHLIGMGLTVSGTLLWLEDKRCKALSNCHMAEGNHTGTAGHHAGQMS